MSVNYILFVFVGFSVSEISGNVKHLDEILASASRRTTQVRNITTADPYLSGAEPFELEGFIRNVAHNLRYHKFNEYDRRYEKDPKNATRTYFSAFPKPALRSLHWEVHSYCEPSFVSCVEYLGRKLKQVQFKRKDDTNVVVEEEGWILGDQNYTQQIDGTDSDCRKLLDLDNAIATPFEGPLERFQWRVTASYYMCWYTTKKTEQLQHLNSSCDNFAGCLDRKFGIHNKDPRADDSVPFSCALYSFCPDPCCPLKHITNPNDCHQTSLNPCHRYNPPNNRSCSFELSENVDFTSVVLNHFNVSCACQRDGFLWSSRYGICVDVNECVEGGHNCTGANQGCINTEGGFKCGCTWGHYWDAKNGTCLERGALKVLKLKRSEENKNEIRKEEKVASSVVKRVYSLLAKGSSERVLVDYRLLVFTVFVWNLAAIFVGFINNF